MNRTLTLAFFLFGILACGPFPDPRMRLPLDMTPPVFTGIVVSDAETIEVVFDENIVVLPEDIKLVPALTIGECVVLAERLRLTVDTQVPGSEYHLEMAVKDLQNNSTGVQIEFYGFNPQVPGIIINEFITNGSSTHPDMLELKILRPGNMGGVAVYQGTPGNFQDKFVFPVFNVKAGEFILLHFKPQNIPGEVNEVGIKTLSGGLDVSENAYDFWITGGTGLSGNNGVLTVYSNPAGVIIDGVLYSNRTSGSDENYLGFGSGKVMERALELSQAGGWLTTEVTIAPEDGINPDDSTSTRSICRHSSGNDTNAKQDWHIVPSRMATFGTENNNAVFVR